MSQPINWAAIPDTLSGDQVVKLMRSNGVTIRELSRRLNVPMTRVRHVRVRGVGGKAFVLDWQEAIAGQAAS